MPIVRINADVLATMAEYVATPPPPAAEYAFELDFLPRGVDYHVENIVAQWAGTGSSAPTPRVHASAHTHYIGNYKEQKCHVGWPSGDDMRWIFGVAVEKGALVVHLCAAVEGTYIVACHLHGASPQALSAHANGEDIFRYFSSSHGHRCAPGHEEEGFPSAEAFVALAHAFRFTGPVCERHAGEEKECSRARPHRERAAGDVGAKQIFFVKFVAHSLLPKLKPGGQRTRTYYGRDARAHLKNINAGCYDHEGTIVFPAAEKYVYLVVPAQHRPVI
jgi:hypothetical protein